MQRLVVAMVLLAPMSSAAWAADLQPGESARELTTPELDSVTAGSSKGGGLLDVDLDLGLVVADVEIGRGGRGAGVSVGIGRGGRGVGADVEIGLGGRPDHGKPKH
jgi:hypothetical protein